MIYTYEKTTIIILKNNYSAKPVFEGVRQLKNG